MPARSESQRRLFAMALAYKRGTPLRKGLSKEIQKTVRELSKLPEKKLELYSRKTKPLPQKVKKKIIELIEIFL